MAIFALSGWQPGAIPAPTPTPTMLPDDFTLIPTFVPSYPCELEQVEVRDDDLCLTERIEEQVLVQGDGVTFIQHDYHIGQGCWGSINQDIHELRVCQRESGVVTMLSDGVVTELLPSPNGEWYAFGTLDYQSGVKPHVYRVRDDGTDLQQLDMQGFPDFAVGAPSHLRWLDDEWLVLTLWTGIEGDYRTYRLKADGSGAYESLPGAEVTEGHE
jgi:hypothetical protein